MRWTFFIRASLAFYLLGTGTGLVLRTAVVSPLAGLNFTNTLHAHSHTLYFGWGSLLLLTLFFRRLGALDRVVRGVLTAGVAVSAATYAAFLHSGYRAPGIIVSTSSLLVWGFAVVLFLRRARGQRGVDLTFLRVAMAYVAFAGLAAATRVVILALKVEDPLWGRLAVFAFLHGFAAFFALGVMGLLLHAWAQRGVKLDPKLLRWQLGFQVPLMALTFPLGVPGGQASALGPTARLAAGLLLVPSALWVWNGWRALAARPAGEKWAYRSLLLAWAGKAVMEAFGALGLAEAAASARHPAILYLHVLLLGFVTAALLLLTRPERPAFGAVAVHQAGTFLMSLGLALASLTALFGVPAPVLGGLWFAVAGGALVVAAGAWALVRELRLPSAPGAQPSAPGAATSA